MTAPGAAAAVLVPTGGIRVGAQQSLFLTGPAPRVLLRHLTRTLNGGQYIRVNMEFQNAGHVSLLVPVMPRTAAYGTFSPAPLFLHPKVTPSPVLPATPSPTPTA
jgi:hypothetical protein